VISILLFLNCAGILVSANTQNSTAGYSYMGYVQVDHGRLKEDMEGLLDLNSDGKVDKEDGDLAYNKVMKVLAFNLPAGGSFGAGFLGGLRTG
jgi:hypothetical protein